MNSEEEIPVKRTLLITNLFKVSLYGILCSNCI